MNQIQPYVGPRPFQRIDEAFFFGREKEASEVLSLIIANPVLLLYARSGAGKTSLLNAKVVPLLEEEDISVLPVARVQGHIPSNLDINKISNLNVYCFNALMSWQTSEKDPSRWATRRLADFLVRDESLSPEQPRVLIFDQFEELFTSYPDRWPDREGLFRQINELMEGSPILLRAEDIVDPQQFVDELRNQQHGLSQLVWTRLSVETQKLASATNGGAASPELVNTLLKDMNRIIDSESIFDRDLFANLALRHQTLDFVERGIRAKDSAKINRLLIEDGFPTSIRRRVEGDPLLRVVFSMREDYIAELDPYAAMLPNRLRVRYRLEPLRRSAALTSVTGPLQKTNLHFAPGVAEQLVDNLLKVPAKPGAVASDIAGEFVEPVQLQVVCQGLWENVVTSGETEITYEHLRTHGDVDKALRRFYENAIAKVIEMHSVKEWSVRRWFEEILITTAGTRGMVFRGPETTARLSNAVVDELESQHIIRAELRGGERWYELSHDRFIQPIRDSNNDWRLARSGAVAKRRELEDRAAQWARAGRPENALLDESAAVEAKRWLESPEANEVGYSNDLFAYIQSSSLTAAKASAARDREIFEREKAQADAIAAEQKRRAEVEQERAEEQARSVRWFRRLAAGLAAVILLAVVFAVFATTQRVKAVAAMRASDQHAREADKQRAEVMKQREEALKQYDEAQKQFRYAQYERAAAEQQRVLAVKNAVEAKQQTLIAKHQEDLARKETLRANAQAQIALLRQKEADDAKQEAQRETAIANENLNIANVEREKARVAQSEAEKRAEIIREQLAEIKAANEAAAEAKNVDELNNQARQLEIKDDLDGALQKYEQALNIYRKNGDVVHEISTLNAMSYLNLRQQKYDRMLEVQQQILSLSRQSRNKQSEGDALYSAALAYSYLNRPNDAIDSAVRAERLYEELNDLRGQANSISVIGHSFADLKDFARSIDMYERSLAINVKLNDGYSAALTNFNLGSVYSNAKEYPKALLNYQKALAYYEKDPNGKGMASATLNTIGYLYQTMGNEKEASKYFARAKATQPQTPIQRRQ